jgi:hypothetical protein
MDGGCTWAPQGALGIKDDQSSLRKTIPDVQGVGEKVGEKK